MSHVQIIGTLSTSSNAQPRPYWPLHEAVSGNTIATIEDRLCGLWGGSGGTTIGSGDDPGAGNRGTMETLATTDGNTNIVALVMGGTNDASSGDIDSTGYERFIRRLFAVAGVTPASALKVYCAFLTGRTDSAPAQTRLDTFNGTTLPAIISTLQTAEFDVDTWDPLTGFNTGTMLLADGLHPNLLGSQHIAQAAYDVLSANGLLTGTHRIVLIGDSITAGGSTLIPQVTAQYRPWLARYIADGGYA